jgi:hypothetical protein
MKKKKQSEHGKKARRRTDKRGPYKKSDSITLDGQTLYRGLNGKFKLNENVDVSDGVFYVNRLGWVPKKLK